jgi:glycosyltransferase involved in cell wall biosynthesis
MSIYIDVSAAVHSKAGIGRYAESLSRTMVKKWPGRFSLFYNSAGPATMPKGLEEVPARTIRAGYKPWRMAVWLGHVMRVGLDRLVPDAELFHATEHLLLPLKGTKTVLTIHDMIFALLPEHQKRLNYWYLNATMPTYALRADAIITVSESSKKDIIARYGLSAGKITVIHEAASPEFRPTSGAEIDSVRRRYGLPDRYMVHVGTIEPRKNLMRLVEALEELRQRGLRVPLVVVGRRGWLYESLFRRLEQMQVRDSVFFSGYVPNDDLPSLYAAAEVAVMPSIYEGCGLPVLEALACGTPMVCSQTSSLPEYGGEAARYFDPLDVQGMAEVIERVWGSRDLQETMRKQGMQQAGRFSWERAALETMAVYEMVLR